VCNVEIILQHDEQSRSYLLPHLAGLMRANKAVFMSIKSPIAGFSAWVNKGALYCKQCYVMCAVIMT